MIEFYESKSEFIKDNCKGMKITPSNISEILAWGKGTVTAEYIRSTGKLCFVAIDDNGDFTRGYFGDYIIKREGFVIYKGKDWERDYRRIIG